MLYQCVQADLRQQSKHLAFCVVGKQHFSVKELSQWKKEVLNIYVALGKKRVAVPIDNTTTSYEYLKIKPTFHRKTTLHRQEPAAPLPNPSGAYEI